MLADFWSVKSDFFLKWLKNVWLFLDHLYIDMKHYKVKAKFYLEFQATSTISSLPTPWIWNIDGIDFSVHQKPFEQGGTGRRGEEGFSISCINILSNVLQCFIHFRPVFSFRLFLPLDVYFTSLVSFISTISYFSYFAGPLRTFSKEFFSVLLQISLHLMMWSGNWFLLIFRVRKEICHWLKCLTRL